MFNIFINDLLFFINEAKLANFSDDNTICAAKRDLNELLRLLEKEREVAIKWFTNNKMIVNPKKFQAIIITRQNRSNHKYCLTINNAEIKSKESVTLLGNEIANKLNFEKHVSTICKKANNQLNAISRIGAHRGQKEKEILINSFVYSNFNYGPLIWHFTTRKGINKIGKVQKSSLKFILNVYDKTYFQLLDISKKPSMKVKRLQIKITEILETLHDSNSVFMKDNCQNKSCKKHNLHVHSRNTSRYGNSSLRILGAHIWNPLQENIKSTDSVYKLKNFLK